MVSHWKMGCDCNTAREKEDDSYPKETLARCLARSMTVRPMYSSRQKGLTRTPTVPLSEEVIRIVTEPLTARYSIEKRLQELGKMCLLQATHLGTGQTCFVKCVEKATGRDSMLQKANLSIESERLNRLDHPLVLRTYETMQDDRCFYLVTEPFLGGTLAEHIKNPLLRKESVAASIMYQLFRALSYCHISGTVHGKLSLHALALLDKNVSEQMKVKLTGFGDFDSLPTSPETKEFAAPEADFTHSEKSDIWSCGVILSRLIDHDFPGRRSARMERRRSSTLYSQHLRCEKSVEVISLITMLMHAVPESRPSAAQCLNHSWILAHIHQPFLKITTFNNCLYNLRKLRNRNPLQQAILKFIVSRIMREKDLENYIHIFYALDKDADGSINDEELRLNFEKIMTDAEATATARRVMEAADYNGNGVISYTEFLISCLGEKKLLSTANLEAAFRCFAKDETGSVPIQEMRNFFFTRGTAEKERQWRELLIQADRSGDNRIDFCEFTALLKDMS